MQPENEETYILGAQLANARLVVDGGSRWKEFGEKFNVNLEAASKINCPNFNPKPNEFRKGFVEIPPRK